MFDCTYIVLNYDKLRLVLEFTGLCSSDDDFQQFSKGCLNVGATDKLFFYIF